MKPITLPAARAQFNEAEATHRANVAALTLAREQLAAAKTALDHLAADDESAVAQHARRLEARARKGEGGAPPVLVPSATHIAAHITATQTHSAARLTVTNLESAARESARALAAAEAALRVAAFSALSEEADARADALEALWARVEEEERILGAVRDVPGFQPSRKVYRALRDSLNLPVSELGPTGSWDKSWNRPVNERDRPPVDAQKFWTDRLAALTTGESVDPAATDVAA